MFLESVSQVQVLKVGASDVQFKPFAPQRKAGICEFPPDLDSLQKGWALWEIVFQGLLHTLDV